jgi:hypothetical protein
MMLTSSSSFCIASVEGFSFSIESALRLNPTVVVVVVVIGGMVGMPMASSPEVGMEWRVTCLVEWIEINPLSFIQIQNPCDVLQYFNISKSQFHMTQGRDQDFLDSQEYLGRVLKIMNLSYI